MRIALIPARKGSTRLPDKNMMEFCGLPLVQWSIDAALKSRLFDKIIISTDWDQLRYEMFERYFLNKEIEIKMRPFELQGDITIDRIIYNTLKSYENDGIEYCLLQPTVPLRTEKHIIESYECFRDHNSCFSINMNTLKTNGAIYWSRDIKDLYKTPCNCYAMLPQESIDIDTINDFRIAEYYKKQLEQFDLYFNEVKE